MSDNVRSCWWNCYAPDDKSVLDDEELLAIDAMEDSLAPPRTTRRQLSESSSRISNCAITRPTKKPSELHKPLGWGAARPSQTNGRPDERRSWRTATVFFRDGVRIKTSRI